MRIAWFRATAPDTADPLDDSASLIDELRHSHVIDVVLEPQAHDFVWQHVLEPWDLCVYELDQTRAHEFMVAYLLNYPGVVMLRSMNVTHLQVPLLASRTVVTPTPEMASMLSARFPEAHLRVAVPGVASTTRGAPLTSHAARIAVFDNRGAVRAVVQRALQRARDAGARFAQIGHDANSSLLSECDIVISPLWPPFAEMPTAALAGMAAGKAVVTMEMETTSGWPALDPQTWRPRDIGVADPPIAVTVDPRDEEHSLVLAVRRLSSDGPLCAQLGEAAHKWWKDHATPAHAAAAWKEIIDEAPRLATPGRPQAWPKPFVEDGTELTRAILSEVGLPPTDILAPS